MDVGDNVNYCPVDISTRNVYDVIAKLKFISKLKPNEKINTQSLTVIASDYITSRLYRTFMERAESRTSVHEFIRNLVDTALTLAQIHLTKEADEQFQLGKLLITSVEEIAPGLKSLKITYEDDRMLVSRLETIVEQYQKKIIHLKNTYIDEPKDK